MGDKKPKHLAIILDGNRRYAKKAGFNRLRGHKFGAKKVEQLFEWCKELGIKELTLYCFSTENFTRPKKEIDYLMRLFFKKFNNLLKDEKIRKNKIRINFIGRLHMFPEKVRELMNEIMKVTKKYNNFKINFAMAYGGRTEIIDAAKKIAHQVKTGKLKISDISEKNFTKNLYLKSEPDMMIRTSEQRISGFLLWQSAYSEIMFLPNKLWPEFTKKDLIKCVKEYGKRQRRFGT